MARTRSTPTHGGRREGAGRRPSEHPRDIQVMVRLSNEEAALLDAHLEEGEGRGTALRRLAFIAAVTHRKK